MGLTVFSEPGCEGTGKELKESEVNIVKAGIKFAIKSARVEGNPWILFTEERYQGFLAYLEEGTYNDLTALGLPSEYKVGSAKYKKESLAFPQIRLFNSSSFKGDPTVGWWTDGDGNGSGKKMKSLDVGLAGTWGITVDQTVRCYLVHTLLSCRWSTGTELGTGLVVPEPGAKNNHYSIVFLNIFIVLKIFRWSNIMAKMRMLSVGASV